MNRERLYISIVKICFFKQMLWCITSMGQLSHVIFTYFSHSNSFSLYVFLFSFITLMKSPFGNFICFVRILQRDWYYLEIFRILTQRDAVFVKSYLPDSFSDFSKILKIVLFILYYVHIMQRVNWNM